MSCTRFEASSIAASCQASLLAAEHTQPMGLSLHIAGSTAAGTAAGHSSLAALSAVIPDLHSMSVPAHNPHRNRRPCSSCTTCVLSFQLCLGAVWDTSC